MNSYKKRPVMSKKSIIIFDGGCRLCNRSVAFVKKHARPDAFCFIPRESKEGQSLLKNWPEAEGVDSIVLLEKEYCYIRSSAALRICRSMKNPWPLLGGLGIIPRPLRDGVYNGIARNRSRWFGRLGSCGL